MTSRLNFCSFLETYFEKGRWVYPLFGMYSLPVAMAIMVVLLLLQTAFLFVGVHVQNLYWGKYESRALYLP